MCCSFFNNFVRAHIKIYGVHLTSPFLTQAHHIFFSSLLCIFLLVQISLLWTDWASTKAKRAGYTPVQSTNISKLLACNYWQIELCHNILVSNSLNESTTKMHWISTCQAMGSAVQKFRHLKPAFYWVGIITILQRLLWVLGILVSLQFGWELLYPTLLPCSTSLLFLPAFRIWTDHGSFEAVLFV